jgi:hypothetical protein
MTDFTTYTEDTSGDLVPFPLIIQSTSTTNSSGVFTLDISNAFLTHIHSVAVSPLASGTAVTDMMVCNVDSFSTSSVSGAVYKFTSTLGVLGLSPVNGKTVYVTIIGDQD